MGLFGGEGGRRKEKGKGDGEVRRSHLGFTVHVHGIGGRGGGRGLTVPSEASFDILPLADRQANRASVHGCGLSGLTIVVVGASVTGGEVDEVMK